MRAKNRAVQVPLLLTNLRLRHMMCLDHREVVVMAVAMVVVAMDILAIVVVAMLVGAVLCSEQLVSPMNHGGVVQIQPCPTARRL